MIVLMLMQKLRPIQLIPNSGCNTPLLHLEGPPNKIKKASRSLMVVCKL